MMMVSWNKSLTEAGCVLLLALTLAGTGLIFRPALWTMLGSQGQPVSENVPQETKRALIISLDEARTYFKTGKTLFADARPLRAYEAGHIPGAMNLDPVEFDSWSENFFSQFPVDTLIVTYCEGARCPLSTELADKLWAMGYENVRVFKEGWRSWKEARLPAEQVAQ